MSEICDVKASKKPKLLDQVRSAIRLKHYSPRTEESYIYWIQGVGYRNYDSIFHVSNSNRYFKISLPNKLSHSLKKYIFFHHKRHPAEMQEKEINAFLSHLATKEMD